ncbi:MAG TPA: TIGR02281 family clan AA aspartic protease [Rickettsia endosymbiont of Columbicola hoogstraali]|nr:TIGR02281 family clan AA aspartic protease [Rickettsia endosymbiont of Columbicola hoogstraali]
MDRKYIKLIFIICSTIFVTGLAYKYIYQHNPKFFKEPQNIGSFCASLLILFSIIYSTISQNEIRKFCLQLAAWAAIFLVIIIGYAFRFELNYAYQRVASVLIPSYNWSTDAGEIIIARSGDGHFYIDAVVNNVKISFMIDTGASDVALTKADAQKLGFDLTQLKYTRTYLTANGENKAAPIKLDSVIIGKEFKNVSGHIGLGDLDVSLLGMSVLERFKGFKIDKDSLILNY